jgi:hypothetical protein
MLAIRPRAHTLLVLALLLLITTLLLLLLHADPAHAVTDPNEPADDDVVTATHLVSWVQVQSLHWTNTVSEFPDTCPRSTVTTTPSWA